MGQGFTRRRLLASFAALMGVAGAGADARAQTFPQKPVQIIVPFAPGGVTDILARALGKGLSERWGQPVTIVNKPGANSQLGTELVARSEPDGHTLLVTADTTFVMNPYLYTSLKYDLGDFAPVSGLGLSPQALVVHPSIPANTFKELIDLSKSDPKKFFYGTFGKGSSGHLNILRLESVTKGGFTAVHYGGAAPAITDLIGGHINMMIVSIGLVNSHWESGAMKVLGFGSDKRIPKYQNIATLSETLPGFDAGSWYGLFAPKNVPADVLAKINADTQQIFSDPEFQERFLAPSYTFSIASDAETFARRIRDDQAKWRDVIRDAKVTMD